MFQIIRDVQGSAFITAVLMAVIILALCAAVLIVFDQSWLMVGLVFWGLVMMLPFVVRGLNMWLFEH